MQTTKSVAISSEVKRTTVLALPGRITQVSLALPPGLSLQEWVEIGRDIARVESASQWWIGDFLLYGAAEWSKDYMQVLDSIGLSSNTLEKMAAISETFDVSRRRESLSWSHHETVATLKPDKIMERLTTAVLENQSCKAAASHATDFDVPIYNVWKQQTKTAGY